MVIFPISFLIMKKKIKLQNNIIINIYNNDIFYVHVKHRLNWYLDIFLKILKSSTSWHLTTLKFNFLSHRNLSEDWRVWLPHHSPLVLIFPLWTTLLVSVMLLIYAPLDSDYLTKVVLYQGHPTTGFFPDIHEVSQIVFSLL